MNREHATKGYQVVSGTDAVTLNFYGFTVLEEAVIDAVTAPTGPGPENTAYSGDEAGLDGVTLSAGLYLPVRGSALELASGKVILWME